MNAHTSVEELLVEVRELDTQKQMLHGAIHDLELQLAALRATKAKVEDELDMYQAAAERVRAGRPAFTDEQRHVVRRTRKQRAPSVPAGELPVSRSDWPVALSGRQRVKSEADRGGSHG